MDRTNLQILAVVSPGDGEGESVIQPRSIPAHPTGLPTCRVRPALLMG